MSRRRLAPALWLTAALACGGTQDAAAPEAEPIAAAIDSVGRPMSLPRWATEGHGGALVFFDAREGGLLRVQPGADSALPVSRRGAGPFEYRGIERILRGRGDSLWVLDRVLLKAIVLDGDARPVREEPSPFPPTFGSALPSGGVRAISEAGDWYSGVREARFAPTFYVDDSASVVRWRRTDGRQDTLARVAMVPVLFNATGAAPRLEIFDPFDAWGVFRDGRVIVVRAQDYSIELVEPDGRVIQAGRGPSTALALTRADAERTRDAVLREREALLRAMPMNPLAGQAGAGAGSRPPPVLPDPLPARWPLLRSSEILVDWQDRAWVRVRTVPSSTGASRYDLFDREGRFLKAVALDSNATLVGFARRALIVAWRDDDDLQWVRWHPLP